MVNIVYHILQSPLRVSFENSMVSQIPKKIHDSCIVFRSQTINIILKSDMKALRVNFIELCSRLRMNCLENLETRWPSFLSKYRKILKDAICNVYIPFFSNIGSPASQSTQLNRKY